MEKIILNDGTTLEIKSMEGLNIVLDNISIEELEKAFTKENCSKIQLTTSTGEVCGIYNNLECVSIIKNLEDSTVIVNLKELNDLEVKMEDLQNTVDTLVIGEVM